MTNNNYSSASPLNTHIVWTLFDYLLSEMGSSAHEKGMSHDLKFTEGNVFDSLVNTATGLGLKINELMLNIEQAVESSGNLTPLVKPLANGDWLVLSGFSRGRSKIALIKGAEVEIHLLRISELAELLQTSPDRLLEWYAVELLAPMDASAHHDAEHMPP